MTNRILSIAVAVLSLSLLLAGCDTSTTEVSVDTGFISSMHAHFTSLESMAKGDPELAEIIQYRKHLFQQWLTSQPVGSGTYLRKSSQLPSESNTARVPEEHLTNFTPYPFKYYVSEINNQGAYDISYHTIEIPQDSISKLLFWPTTDFEIKSLSSTGDTLVYVYGTSSTYTPLLHHLKRHFGLNKRSQGKRAQEGCTWVGDNTSGLTLSCDIEVTGTGEAQFISYRYGNDVVPGSTIEYNDWDKVDDFAKGGGSYTSVINVDTNDYVEVRCKVRYKGLAQDPSTMKVDLQADIFCTTQVKSNLVRHVRSSWDMQMHGMTTTYDVSRAYSVESGVSISFDPNVNFGASHRVTYSDNVQGFVIGVNTHTSDTIVPEVWDATWFSSTCSPNENQIGFMGMAVKAVNFTMDQYNGSFTSRGGDRNPTAWIQCSPE